MLKSETFGKPLGTQTQVEVVARSIELKLGDYSLRLLVVQRPGTHGQRQGECVYILTRRLVSQTTGPYEPVPAEEVSAEWLADKFRVIFANFPARIPADEIELETLTSTRAVHTELLAA